ncbi:MAG: thioredoxin domain-containing protein, partial [Planctomycetota bacterium]
MRHLVFLIVVCACALAGDLACGERPTEEADVNTVADVKHIDWLEWGPEAFETAAREDKLVLLDSGATWCHWCHVMDRVTYEDPEVVEMLNARFVAIRIDRDRLPQVDAAMQQALPVIQSRGGGWPLTVVLSPQGHVLYKATFLPPRADPRYGSGGGLIDVLDAVDRMWRERRDEMVRLAEDVDRQMAQQRRQAVYRPGELDVQTVDALTQTVRRHIDPTHGGFGDAPKFFQAPALELLARAAWAGDDDARDDLVRTLDAIVRGGVHDHVGGGFHRYSVDERWHVPHFEKMAYDNAALLRLLANAYATTGREDFARAARRTMQWVRDDLTGPDGAFYASQDADVGLDDDGDAFTWTVDEVRDALGDDADVAISYFDVDAGGDMHARPGRNVLHTPKTIEQEAALLGIDAEDLAERIDSILGRLLAARRQRTQPGIDHTVFADLNGMLIDAHLTAWWRLGDPAARDAAFGALEAVLTDLHTDSGAFAHYREDGRSHRVGLLADQAWMLRALMAA